MATIKVTIPYSGYIPFVGGNGPINTPMTMNVNDVNVLRNMGIPVEEFAPPKAVELAPAAKPETKETGVTPGSKETESSANETDSTDDGASSNDGATSDGDGATSESEAGTEEVVEVVVDDPNFSGDAYYTQEFVEAQTSKKNLQKILDARQENYDARATLADLKAAVLATNPDVQFES